MTTHFVFAQSGGCRKSLTGGGWCGGGWDGRGVEGGWGGGGASQVVRCSEGFSKLFGSIKSTFEV